jgi:hypothetical protein
VVAVALALPTLPLAVSEVVADKAASTTLCPHLVAALVLEEKQQPQIKSAEDQVEARLVLGPAAQELLLQTILLYPEVSQEAKILVSRFAPLGALQITLAVAGLVQTSVLLDFLLNGAEGLEVRPEHQEV